MANLLIKTKRKTNLPYFLVSQSSIYFLHFEILKLKIMEFIRSIILASQHREWSHWEQPQAFKETQFDKEHDPCHLKANGLMLR